MPPDPNVLIVFGSALVALISSFLYAAWYQQFKHKHKGPRLGSDDPSRSISLSELEGLIRKAVAEATDPLDDRLGAMQSEMRSLHALLREDDTRALREGRNRTLLSPPVEEPEERATGGTRALPEERTR